MKKKKDTNFDEAATQEDDVIYFGGESDALSQMHDEIYDEDDYSYDGYDDDDIYDFSKPESSTGAWASFILGIVASLGWIIPIIGLPVTIVGIVLGALNMKNYKAKGIAIAGFVINIVFLCASIAKGIVDIVGYMKNKKMRQ